MPIHNKRWIHDKISHWIHLKMHWTVHDKNHYYFTIASQKYPFSVSVICGILFCLNVIDSIESISSLWIHYLRLDSTQSHSFLLIKYCHVENWVHSLFSSKTEIFKTLGNHLFKYWIKYQYLWWWMVKECISFQLRPYFENTFKKALFASFFPLRLKWHVQSFIYSALLR